MTTRPPAPNIAASPTDASRQPATHDFSEALAVLKRSLHDGSRSIAVLLGAGTSTSVETASGPLVPGIVELTRKLNEDLQAEHTVLKVLDAMLKADGTAEPTIEDYLSRLRSIASISGGESVRGMAAHEVREVEAALVEQISRLVNVALPTNGGGFDALALWAGAYDRSKALEVFTLNYDLLVEQALERHRIAFFDGFLGSFEPFLDVRTIEDDLLPSRWVRLWKMHGSVNWVENSGRVFRRSIAAGEASTSSLIHPSHLKYDQSRRMPYLIMQDRLRAFLRQQGATVLITGYSFGDEHVNEMVLEGLRGNPTAVVFGLLWGNMDNYSKAVELASRTGNLRLMAADGGVIHGERRKWGATEKAAISPSELVDFDKIGRLLAVQSSVALDA